MAEGRCRVCGATTSSPPGGGKIAPWCSYGCQRAWTNERRSLEHEIAFRKETIAEYEDMLLWKPRFAEPALKHHRALLVEEEQALAEFLERGKS